MQPVLDNDPPLTVKEILMLVGGFSAAILFLFLPASVLVALWPND